MRAEIMVTKLNSFNEDLAMTERTSLQLNCLLDGIDCTSIPNGTLETYKKEEQFLEESHSADSKTTTNISRKNWEMSYKKWRWLVILARLHIRFHSKNGFSFLNVIGKCGYCIEFKSNCFNCNLYKQNLCCSMKNLTKEKRKNTALWNYLSVMQKGVRNYNVKINWKKEVLTYAIEMRDAIRKDKPKRQIKISSIFTFLQIFFPKVA
jgi:hypothetical protein